ncbi:MAG TPA: rhodanese-like domain-containing protein [Granulicella sp.]|jgi:rhodanese-related sulfurtransferase|nr:rhodanese-like domain-containing protein [Granulicella sp.]
MTISLSALAILAACILAYLWLKRQQDRRAVERSSISPEELHSLLNSDPPVLLFDVRLPLDLLSDSQIIPGSRRVPPKDILTNPNLLPRDQDIVVYCTCPSDATSRQVLGRTRALKFFRIKFLKGGLAAWKAKGFPVEPYTAPFRLDTLV